MPGPHLRLAQPGVAAATFTTSQLLALQAFDVAVRLGTFKAAAHRLNLTVSAVSHRIKSLERALGVELMRDYCIHRWDIWEGSAKLTLRPHQKSSSSSKNFLLEKLRYPKLRMPWPFHF